jgi:hypothetical protein
MYCGRCDTIPFWRWLKLSQKFSNSIGCYDYNGEQLFSLQPNKVTDCFGEYLSTFGYQIYRIYIKNIDTFCMK